MSASFTQKFEWEIATGKSSGASEFPIATVGSPAQMQSATNRITYIALHVARRRNKEKGRRSGRERKKLTLDQVTYRVVYASTVLCDSRVAWQPVKRWWKRQRAQKHSKRGIHKVKMTLTKFGILFPIFPPSQLENLIKKEKTRENKNGWWGEKSNRQWAKYRWRDACDAQRCIWKMSRK